MPSPHWTLKNFMKRSEIWLINLDPAFGDHAIDDCQNFVLVHTGSRGIDLAIDGLAAGGDRDLTVRHHNMLFSPVKLANLGAGADQILRGTG